MCVASRSPRNLQHTADRQRRTQHKRQAAQGICLRTMVVERVVLLGDLQSVDHLSEQLWRVQPAAIHRQVGLRGVPHEAGSLAWV